MHIRCLLPLLLFLVAAGSAATPDSPRVTLFVLLRDSTAASTPPASGALARRVAAFERDATRARESLRNALPPALAQATDFEALPALGAWLVSLPAGTSRAARSALAALPDVAEVAVHGTADARALESDREADRPTPMPPQPRRAPLTLGLIDHGIDASHPFLARTLGRLYFLPGTPGARADGELLRSHGTAMAGIVAQLAHGEALASSGVVQPWLRLPRAVPITATLVARAGPETRAGRSALVRALNWMLLPDPGCRCPISSTTARATAACARGRAGSAPGRPSRAPSTGWSTNRASCS